MNDDRKKLSVQEAITMLPDGDTIHVISNDAPGILIGADWPREDVISEFEISQLELAGPVAKSSGHGIAMLNKNGRWFVETKQAEELED